MIICCAGCDTPITDKFLLTVLDRTWHADCVRCTDCRSLLTEKCFSREGKLFCRIDFFKRFGTKCSGCLQGISPQDLVRKARDRVFHLKCFTCCVCRKQLSTGEELYVLDENRFICKQDYINGKSHSDTFVGGVAPSDEDEEEHMLDVKPPHIDDSSNTPIPTPPTSTTPSMTSSMTSSPAGSLVPPIPHQSSTMTPPMPRSMASPGTVGFHPQTPSFAGLIGRVASPGSGGSLGIGSIVGHSNMADTMVNFGDTPPSEKDGGCSTYHESSDVSDTDDANDSKDMSLDGSKLTDEDKNGNKRRGPRTTIKAKQLEVLKSAFATTPKPTRHIREQLAKETGLPMRVIQVWFQNKRSKERRMKQLSSLGMRAHIFGNPRKLRGMRMSPGMEDGYPFYGDAFGYGPQGFPEFFPGQGPPQPHPMSFTHGLPPAMEQPLPPGGPMGDFSPLQALGGPTPISDSSYLGQPQEILSQGSSPDVITSHGGQGTFDQQTNEGLVW